MPATDTRRFRLRADTIRRIDRFATLFGSVSHSRAVDLGFRVLEHLYDAGLIGESVPIGVLFPETTKPAPKR